jgi:hypothetical protein
MPASNVMVGTGGATFTVTSSVAASEVLQLFDAVTETVPEFSPKITTISFVPSPDIIVAPSGSVQL